MAASVLDLLGFKRRSHTQDIEALFRLEANGPEGHLHTAADFFTPRKRASFASTYIDRLIPFLREEHEALTQCAAGIDELANDILLAADSGADTGLIEGLQETLQRRLWRFRDRLNAHLLREEIALYGALETMSATRDLAHRYRNDMETISREIRLTVAMYAERERALTPQKLPNFRRRWAHARTALDERIEREHHELFPAYERNMRPAGRLASIPAMD